HNRLRDTVRHAGGGKPVTQATGRRSASPPPWSLNDGTSTDQLAARFREHHFEKRFERDTRAHPLSALDTVQRDHGPCVEPKNAARTRAGFFVGPKSEDAVVS